MSLYWILYFILFAYKMPIYFIYFCIYISTDISYDYDNNDNVSLSYSQKCRLPVDYMLMRNVYPMG